MGVRRFSVRRTDELCRVLEHQLKDAWCSLPVHAWLDSDLRSRWGSACFCDSACAFGLLIKQDSTWAAGYSNNHMSESAQAHFWCWTARPRDR
eukprot:6203139-Pleurochrysis_carterae.AAC.1